MDRLVARATFVVGLLWAATTAAAQQLFCSPPEMLRDPAGTPVFLGKDGCRLTTFASPLGDRPRLVYRKFRPGFAAGHELRVLEGSRPQSLGGRDDCAATLPMSVFAGFTAPWVEDFDLAGKWVLVAVADARTASPLLSRAPAQVVLIELAPQAQVAGVHVLASYWSDGTHFPRVNHVRIDREPDPAAPGPYVSWSVTHDAWQSSTADDLYYCRIGAAGPLSAPQRAYAFDDTRWSAITRHVVTEGGRQRPSPQVLVSARSVPQRGGDVGIFEASASRLAPRPWLDQAGSEEVLDRRGSTVFYLAPGRLGQTRVHAAFDRNAERATVWFHDGGPHGDDAAFALSREPGYTRATWPAGEPRQVFGMFESHTGRTFRRPPGCAGGELCESEIVLLEAGRGPVNLRDLIAHVDGLSSYTQAVTQNLCVVSVAPDPDRPQFRFVDFVDPSGDLLAFWFHLAQ